jgi:hypothetical protein
LTTFRGNGGNAGFQSEKYVAASTINSSYFFTISDWFSVDSPSKERLNYIRRKRKFLVSVNPHKIVNADG